MIEITWREAEKLAGFRVDRRKRYAKHNDESKCEMSGAVIFELCKWTGVCTGCECDSYGFQSSKNTGCWECGYTGVRKKAMWVPYTESLRQLEKKEA
jgi:hypothetical protein